LFRLAFFSFSLPVFPTWVHPRNFPPQIVKRRRTIFGLHDLVPFFLFAASSRALFCHFRDETAPTPKLASPLFFWALVSARDSRLCPRPSDQMFRRVITMSKFFSWIGGRTFFPPSSFLLTAALLPFPLSSPDPKRWSLRGNKFLLCSRANSLPPPS